MLCTRMIGNRTLGDVRRTRKANKDKGTRREEIKCN
jgi:hypothetical protein